MACGGTSGRSQSVAPWAVFGEVGCRDSPNYNGGLSFDDYKLVIYRNRPDGWVAEIPAIAGCHALMPTAEEAVAELAKVFQLIEEEHRTVSDVPMAPSTSVPRM